MPIFRLLSLGSETPSLGSETQKRLVFLGLSDDFSLKNRTLDLVNDVGLIREVSFMQSVLSQQEQKEDKKKSDL